MNVAYQALNRFKSVESHPAQNNLELYYCNMLVTPELESVEDHLLSCQDCRMRLDAIRRFVDRLALGVRRDFDA